MSRNWLAFTPNRLPIVTVSLRTASVSALIDTGAQISMLSPALAAIYQLPITGQIRLTGITGTSQWVETAVVEGLQLGALRLEPLKVALVDVGRLQRDIEIILGVNAFAHRKLHFHFKEGRVFLLD